MKTEMIRTLTTTFEAHAQQTESGIEYWLARDLQHLLGYDEWRNFNTAVSKAKTACEVSGHWIGDHFVDVNKMVELGSGSQCQIEDIMLNRNQAMCKALLERSIRPESLPAVEDLKKVERSLASEEKKSLKSPDSLESRD